tara:strand:- start:614 stop:853 length:240 start_codon:yes stop_codon:yes gene_type:complete
VFKGIYFCFDESAWRMFLEFRAGISLLRGVRFCVLCPLSPITWYGLLLLKPDTIPPIFLTTAAEFLFGLREHELKIGLG